MTRQLVVVAHEATRTGAPRVLLDLLRHAKSAIPVPVSVRLLAHGPLAASLLELSDVVPAGTPTIAVVANGASAAGRGARIDPEAPLLAYVHEEQEALANLPPDCKQALADRCVRVLCVSERSAEGLEALGVDPSRLAILPPVVRDLSHVVQEETDPDHHPPGLPTVVGCGEASWRKGADLFVDVARRVNDAQPTRFVWIGRRSRRDARLLDNDTQAAGLKSRLSWAGELENVGSVLATSDLLLMPSREDPNPLVPLEAASLGVATAGFSVGGIADLARVGAAVAVPYPDTFSLANEALALLDDAERRACTAGRAKRRRDEHHSLAVAGDRFVDEILRLVGVDR